MATTRTVTKYDKNGKPISSTSTSTTPDPPNRTPKTTMANFGFNRLYLDWLKSHPEIGLPPAANGKPQYIYVTDPKTKRRKRVQSKGLLYQAVTQNWSQERWQSAIAGSKWGTSRTEAQRKWELGKIGSPAEFKKQIDDEVAALQAQATSMGVAFDPKTERAKAEWFLATGATALDKAAYLASKFTYDPESTEPLTGTIGANIDSLIALAADYGETLTKEQATQQVQQAITTGTSVSSFEDVYREAAKARFPSVADQLDTKTLRQVMNPYLTDASSLLGFDVNLIDLGDPKWTAPLEYRADAKSDPKQMTRQEWIDTLKQDKKYRYEYSINAINEARDTASSIIKAFGGV